MSANPPPTAEERFLPIYVPRRNDPQIGYLVDLLSDDDPGNRWKAAQALGRTRDPAAVDGLLRAIYDDDWRVQQKAIWALGSIGDPRAIPHLRRRYAEVDDGLRDLIRNAQELIRARTYRPE